MYNDMCLNNYVLGHVDSGHLESDLSDQSRGDQAGLLIPDSVCSDSSVVREMRELRETQRLWEESNHDC